MNAFVESMLKDEHGFQTVGGALGDAGAGPLALNEGEFAKAMIAVQQTVWQRQP
jgi:hypothetical protein